MLLVKHEYTRGLPPQESKESSLPHYCQSAQEYRLPILTFMRQAHFSSGNSLGAFESAVMGIAGTAPALSVAVTSATIVAAVGVLTAASG